jgi:hypothetical protein
MRYLLLSILLGMSTIAESAAQKNVVIRGKLQELHLYGEAGGMPVILSSGDLGWAGLAVHVAEFLSARGYYVIGFNSRLYLTSFTSRQGALQPKDVPGDYRVLVDQVGPAPVTRPVLAGISEGAGLSVLAATHPDLKGSILGVLALGLPDQNELGWKWQDSTIWLTKKAPDEPSFFVRDIIERVSPVPLAEIHSTHDEFLALDKAIAMFGLAGEPKRMWTIEASNHRFSDNRAELDKRILEAFEWIRSRKR